MEMTLKNYTLTFQLLFSLSILFLIEIKIKIKQCMLCMAGMNLSTCNKLQLIHCHAQDMKTDNTFPRNEVRT